ncbi:hypothetical protein E3N88_18161 [Mikania micrantha]|uniref:Reverse transcriptase/retrotransposon-derived protein RNase H-like domain-containing protein n=1 Tax=Mikania micrantha TaxID=192012 RepID=A0A5N6NW52_9ASTR|nr:hypothetical protein E3N88_18161 [Mikania micrantha]
MASSQSKKEVQSLNAIKLGALHRFLSKLAEKYLPFFRTPKNYVKTFIWSHELEKAFQEIKAYIASVPPSVALGATKNMSLYIVVGNETVSSVLIMKNSRQQCLRRLEKYAIEVREHGITYQPCIAIKGQVMADFIMEGMTTEQCDNLVMTSAVEPTGVIWLQTLESRGNADDNGF